MLGARGIGTDILDVALIRKVIPTPIRFLKSYWMSGVNPDVEGKQQRVFVRYDGIWPDYRSRCRKISESGYQELQLS